MTPHVSTSAVARDATRASVLSPISATDLVARAHARVSADDRGPVPVLDPDPVEALTNVLAVLAAGRVAVVADPDWPTDVRRRALDAGALAAGRVAGPGLVVFTSGTTGTPNPVARTYASWTRSFPAFTALTGISPDDTVLISGRPSASLFLFGAMHAVAVGAAVCFLPRWQPRLVAEAARRCSVVHLVPAMLADLVGAPTAVRSLRLAVCAGAHLPDATRTAATATGLAVVDYYGASELSFVAIRRPDEARLRPFPGVEIDVTDPAGLIAVRSPYLAEGLPRDPRGYATVGDYGVRHPDGTLTVLGRGDAVIETGGASVHAEGVEQVLRTAPGVADVAVAGQPHERLGRVVTAVIEPRFTDPPRLSALRAVAADRLMPVERPRRWYVMSRLPRTYTGKVARGAVAAALAAGKLRPLR